MALSIETSPALEASLDTITTDAFNAAASTFLVAAFAGVPGFGGGGISGGGLTWTLRRDNTTAKIWTAPVPTLQTGMTVQIAGGSYGGQAGLKIWVVGGVDLTAPVGSGGTGTSSSNAITPNAYTTTGIGTLGFCAAHENNIVSTSNPTSSDVAEVYSMYALSGGSPGAGLTIRKASASTAAGQSVTFNMDAFGTGTAQWFWAAIEVMGLPDAVRPHVIHSVSAVHRAASW